MCVYVFIYIYRYRYKRKKNLILTTSKIILTWVNLSVYKSQF